MATRLYFHAASNPLSNLPTTEQSSLTSDKDVDAQSVNRTMDPCIGISQTSITLTSNATVSIQRYYFTRFVSQALSGVTSITAQTWNYDFAVFENNASANFPCSSNNPVRAMAYVWRPSTQTKVGNIFDGNTSNTIELASAERSSHVNFSGSLVSSVQDGDVICFEVIFEITQAAATAYTDTFYFDGTVVTTTPGTVSDHASFIETPQDLTFSGGRLYFHAASNSLSNLPTTEQSSLTSIKNVDAQTVNRTLSKTIGTSQASLALTSNATVSAQNYYFSRFVTDTLSGITSIVASSWIYNFSALESNASANFPVGVNNSPCRITLYVWRPSTQTKVGDILDGNSASTLDEAFTVGPSGQVGHTTFTGSLVSSVQDGDVVCFEVWFQVTQAAATAYTDTWFYDGTTVNTTKNASTSSHASFIESSQILTFGAAPTNYTRALPTETTSVSETLARLAAHPRSIATETTTISETIARQAINSRAITTETTTVSESLARQAAHPRTMTTETVTIGESIARVTTNSRSLTTETTTVSESMQRLYGANRAILPTAVAGVIFDGVDDSLDCTNDATLWSQSLTKFSFSFWVKCTAIPLTNRTLVNHGYSTNQSFMCHRDNGNGEIIRFRIRNAAGTDLIAGILPSTTILNRWIHVACVFDSTLGSANLKVYGDAVLGGTTANLASAINLSATLAIDGTTSSGTGYQSGTFKDFRWYSTKALTSTEVTDIYNNSGSAPTPDYWLKMNEGTGNPVDTISGTKTATLTNGATWQVDPTGETVVISESLATVLTPGAGGVNYVRTLPTETVTIGETISKVITNSRPITETVPITEDLQRLCTANRLLATETVTIGETISKTITNARPLATETVTVGESLARMQIANRVLAAQTTTIGETLARLYAATRTIPTETTTIAENQTTLKTLIRTIATETVTIGESILRTLGANRPLATQTTTVSETIARLYAANRAQPTETVTIGETQTTLKSFIRTLATETVIIGESLARAFNGVRLIPAETVIITGGTLARLYNAMRLLAAETIPISESQTTLKTLIRTLATETVTVTGGTLVRLLSATRSLATETIVANATLVRLFVGQRLLAAQTTAISENLATLYTPAPPAGTFERQMPLEVVAISESLNRVVTNVRILPETIVVAGSPVRVYTANRSIATQTTPITDLSNRLYNATRTIPPETILATGTLNRSYNATRTTQDTISIAETLQTLLTIAGNAFVRTLLQTVSITESLARAFQGRRTLVETVPISELLRIEIPEVVVISPPPLPPTIPPRRVETIGRKNLRPFHISQDLLPYPEPREDSQMRISDKDESKSETKRSGKGPSKNFFGTIIGMLRGRKTRDPDLEF